MTPSGADCSANIFPKLSCGASCTTRPRCESAGCCWADNACTAPAVYGYSASSPSVENNGVITANLALINSSGIFDSEDYMVSIKNPIICSIFGFRSLISLQLNLL